MSGNAFDCLAALVFADEGVAASLASLAESDQLAACAAALARSKGVEGFDANSLGVGGNDPLGVSRWEAPRRAGRALPPRHWLPIHVSAATDGIAVDWAWFGPAPIGEPFFEDSVRNALRRPFARTFRYRTTLGDLIAQAETCPACRPDGFIFHMSRCGSTLAAQMLAALPGSIVVSEAAPIDAVVQLARTAPDGADDRAVSALRAMIAAFGRKRAGDERRYLVKLDSWHILALPLFRRAFPDVPWVFLHRDPIEVLVSQMRQRGTQMLPQFFPPRFWGIADSGSMPDADYCAQVLAAICNAAADHAPLGGGRMIDYRDLPDAVTSVIAPHFGLTLDAAERAAMEVVAHRDAKAPYRAFAPDSTGKHREASDAVRQAAGRHVDAAYRRIAGVGVTPVSA